ncbi:hypothetical protein MKW94_000485 [Papaver nudicaule]|uniref:Uncharacterized protein n=1 Tax=Papaver nudicaule TaxID=74823 RepID=A0AA41RJJ3_PAPNU|nr:hypothetical protein [Papaver nudicaule]
MGTEALPDNHQLHVFLFPVTAHGHMIPMVDIARLFAARGLKSTIVTTPLNATNVSKTTERDRLSGFDINVRIIPFPAVEVGLPEGVESVDELSSPDMVSKFFVALNMLQQPFEELIEAHHPDFVIADMFLPWTTESAAKFGIPRIVFHGQSFFALSFGESLAIYKPWEAISTHADANDSSFVIPGLPDKIEMNMSQLSDDFKSQTIFSEIREKVRESELNSYGILVNSFYELEPAYAEHYRNALGRKAWHIGPVSLRNKDVSDKAQRGRKSTIDEHYVLNWLDSKEPNSVLYVSFGSISRFSNNQLLELAMGLESSGCSFIWVIRQRKNEDGQIFFPQGFEDRIEGKGLIVRDWAPQVLILDHFAVGGFLTHCGWNSVVEGLSAGVPMITWPMFADQFYNEMFVTQVIKAGIRVGVEEYVIWVDGKDGSLVKRDKVKMVVNQLIGQGDEAKEMRKRAKEISEMAKKSVEEGGSSYADLTTLIEEMKNYTSQKFSSSIMGSETITGHQQLHVYLFPVMAQGHMIPTLDIARLLAARGLKSTVICTPFNAISISKTIERDRLSGLSIDVQTIPFPAAEVGLQEGIESMDKVTSPEMVSKFISAIALLQQPFEQLLEEHRPDFVIAGMFLPWATESAARFGIPRIVFHGTSCFSLSVGESLKLHKPYEAISIDADPHSSFVIPGLPDKIEMTMAQLPDHFKGENAFAGMMEKVRESERNSYGVLVNSFYELEPAYAEHYKNILGRKTWHIGPVSLRNTDILDKAQRGKKSTIDEHYVLNWLNSKEPNSVLYVSFGSVSRVSNNQLLELAMGLESSGHPFIWVVRQIKNDDQETFLPEGFEERIEGKGLIIRDWAPQVLILDHPAVGAFMTHCGWNSLLEGISAGIPMITWPMFAEQFYNEKFITQVIKTGAQLGAKEYNMWVDAKNVSLLKKEQIATVVTQLMGDGEEAKEMRQRAKEIGEMAKRSVEEGGSSYADLTALIEEMKAYSKK